MVWPPGELVKFARGRLKGKVKDLFDSMDGALSPAHRLVLKDIRKHMDYLDEHIAELESERLYSPLTATPGSYYKPCLALTRLGRRG